MSRKRKSSSSGSSGGSSTSGGSSPSPSSTSSSRSRKVSKSLSGSGSTAAAEKDSEALVVELEEGFGAGDEMSLNPDHIIGVPSNDSLEKLISGIQQRRWSITKLLRYARNLGPTSLSEWIRAFELMALLKRQEQQRTSRKQSPAATKDFEDKIKMYEKIADTLSRSGYWLPLYSKHWKPLSSSPEASDQQQQQPQFRWGEAAYGFLPENLPSLQNYTSPPIPDDISVDPDSMSRYIQSDPYFYRRLFAFQVQRLIVDQLGPRCMDDVECLSVAAGSNYRPPVKYDTLSPYHHYHHQEKGGDVSYLRRREIMSGVWDQYYQFREEHYPPSRSGYKPPLSIDYKKPAAKDEYKLIGSGSYGKVFSLPPSSKSITGSTTTTSTSSGRPSGLVIKVINSKYYRVDKDTFEREVYYLVRLRETGVVPYLYDYWCSEGFFYMLMEGFDCDLYKFCWSRGKRLNKGHLEQLAHIAQVLTDAGLVHGDIHQCQFLISGDAKKIVLTDFGLSGDFKHFAPDEGVTAVLGAKAAASVSEVTETSSSGSGGGGGGAGSSSSEKQGANVDYMRSLPRNQMIMKWFNCWQVLVMLKSLRTTVVPKSVPALYIPDDVREILNANERVYWVKCAKIK